MTYGRWLAVAAGVIIIVAVADAVDPRLAMGLAVVTLLAVWFHNRDVFPQILDILGGR